jgi:prepilin peptidase CpaA
MVVTSILLVFVCIAAVFDWRGFRIPNWLTLPVVIAALLFHAATGGWPAVAIALGGALLGFALLFLPFALGGFGGGDVKLLMAVGAWAGPVNMLTLFVVSALLLGAVSLYKMLKSADVWHRGMANLKIAFVQMWAFANLIGGDDRVEDVVQQEDRDRRLVPFAVVFACGVIACLCFSLATGAGFTIPSLLSSSAVPRP